MPSSSRCPCRSIRWFQCPYQFPIWWQSHNPPLGTAGNRSRQLSLDKRPVDSYGRQLLQFCNDRNLSILNGCAPGGTQGYFTYERGLCRSVIDYGIVSQSIWPCVRSFQVGVHNSILSDHSIIRLELKAQQPRPPTHTNASTDSPLLRFDWNPESKARLKDQLSETRTQLKIQIMEAKLKLDNPDLDPTSQICSWRKPRKCSSSAHRALPLENKRQPKDGTISPYELSRRTSPTLMLIYELTHPPTSANKFGLKRQLIGNCSKPKHTDLSSSSKIKCSPRRIDPPKNGGRCYRILDLMPSGKILITTSTWLILLRTSDRYTRIPP